MNQYLFYIALGTQINDIFCLRLVSQREHVHNRNESLVLYGTNSTNNSSLKLLLFKTFNVSDLNLKYQIILR